MASVRKIIHIDMDAFYASIEQRDNPDLKGKPVAVGKGSERGVVSAASYEARKYGIRSAMSSKIARRKCPHLIFVKGRMEHYKEVSKEIMEIFYEYTNLVEPLSIDEAFLDVTINKKNLQSATLIAKEIKEKIFYKTQLTASAGVSINKFLAKIASDYDKPDGLFVIKPHEAEQFVEDLPIHKFHGVGNVTAQKMKKLGVHNGRDLKEKTQPWLIKNFGKAGIFYYQISRAIDEREVNPNRERKSVGTEKTFEKDLQTPFEIITALYHIEHELMRRMERAGSFGRTLTLKIKFSDFRQITRSKTIPQKIDNFDLLHSTTKEIYNTLQLENSKIRLLGLSVSYLDTDQKPEAVQLELDF
ncbi:MAG: DNA polymerase IV [Bacteroidales bacterium]